jgi:site-specific recombinase XerD
VSNLAAAGVDQRVIDELMGHTTLEMQKRYGHLFPAQRRDAVTRVYAMQPESRPANGFSPSA